MPLAGLLTVASSDAFGLVLSFSLLLPNRACCKIKELVTVQTQQQLNGFNAESRIIDELQSHSLKKFSFNVYFVFLSSLVWR
jgi:hypothetical protein